MIDLQQINSLLEEAAELLQHTDKRNLRRAAAKFERVADLAQTAAHQLYIQAKNK